VVPSAPKASPLNTSPSSSASLQVLRSVIFHS
jgi:hypothetical protein